MNSKEMCDLGIVNERLKHLDEASREGDINKLNQLMEEDPSLLDVFDRVVTDRARDNPLHIAASHGHVDFTIKVLGLKPKLAEMRNRAGKLPLHLAAASGHHQVAEKLVDQQDGRKFCLWPAGKYEYLPVHIAAINGKHTIMKMLVDKCKDVLDKTTRRKENLLHLAVIANCLDSVHYLINEGVNPNEKDVDGNTSLHLACYNKNHQVITYLLDHECIEVNSTNSRGLTPLDVLSISSRYSATDISVMSILRRAGGEETTKRGNSKSYFSNTKNQSDAQTLLLGATLVATITFVAISNPPGGFIAPQFEKSDSSNITFYDDWISDNFYPAGRPVLLWRLKTFFVLDSLALFSSISVILFLLCGIPRTKIVMKFLVGVLWLSAFCTALAFASAAFIIYVPYSTRKGNNGSFQVQFADADNRFNWVLSLLIAWFVVFAIAGLWASSRVITFLWIKGGFKRNLPNWANKISWPKNERFRKPTSVIFMVCFLAILCLSGYGMYSGFTTYINL
ncbi:Ankyrin repeat family protein [Rhynchospora pubera]|uniref:Ankyrin repeat family protein n=1 Tax=Rhynchospora pubera TaxID=906938 RepID=A0AAV8DUR2_9POAL|nr:Ankyrin repeat family protein [Rhynchospora pubera]